MNREEEIRPVSICVRLMFVRSRLDTNGARRDDHSLVSRSLARLSAHPLGLAPSPTAFSMVRPTRRATKFTHLFEEHLVVGLLLHLPLGPFLRAREKPRVGVVDVSHRAHPLKRIRALGSSETSPLETRSRPSLASIDRTHARERIHSDRSPSRPPRVLLAHRPYRHRPLASSLGSPRLARSHRFRVSLERTLAFFLPPAKALAALAAFDSGAFGGIFRSCATRATERRPRSRARDLDLERDREACDRSIGGSLVELFTVSFSFQYERVRARWVLCNEETPFNVFFQVSYVPKVRSLSIDKTAIDATNGRVVASDASTAFDRARSASRARTKERWVGAPVRRERCANS